MHSILHMWVTDLAESAQGEMRINYCKLPTHVESEVRSMQFMEDKRKKQSMDPMHAQIIVQFILGMKWGKCGNEMCLVFIVRYTRIPYQQHLATVCGLCIGDVPCLRCT